MTEYHTINIAKKYYRKIDQYRGEKTVFDNTKAFILHGVTLAMKERQKNTMESIALDALNILEEENEEISEEDVSSALNSALNQRLDK
jgi:hypothetical protein